MVDLSLDFVWSSLQMCYTNGVGMHAHETQCSQWGLLIVVPSMECLDPTVPVLCEFRL